MASPQQKGITVALNDKLLSVLSQNFWYAPASNVLVYNNHRVFRDNLEVAINRPPESIDSQSGLWIFGGASSNELNAGSFLGIAMGGRARDSFTAIGSGFAWGGQDSDTFQIDYNPKTKTVLTKVLDLNKNDIVSFALTEDVRQAQFDASVANLTAAYRGKVAQLKFEAYVLGKTFNGSQYDDEIFTTDNRMTVHGGKGNDVISGNESKEYLYGDEGDDTIDGCGGKDVIYAGKGRNTIHLYDGDTVYDIDADDTIIVRGLNVTLPSIGCTIIYDLSNDGPARVLKGGRNNDTLMGSGKDTLYGLGGADTFQIQGNDEIVDLSSDDTVFVMSENANLRQRMITQGVISGARICFNIDLREYVIGTEYHGWAYDDGISGSSYNDTLYGGSGDDQLIGASGDDLIWGEDGDDWITDDDGNDSLFGGDGDDYIFDGYGHNFLNGGNGEDTLSASAGNNTIHGGAGNDIINGGSGEDCIIGDTLSDLLLGASGSGFNDTLNGGGGRDSLWGCSGDDILIGGDGADYLNGGVGNDTLVGGMGNDTLIGRDGADVFVFAPGDGNNNAIDTIMDFTSGVDKIDLSAFSLMVGYNASLFSKNIRFDAKANLLSVDANGDGFVDLRVKFDAINPLAFDLKRDLVINNLYAASA